VSGAVVGYLLVGTLALMYLAIAGLSVWFVVKKAVRALRGRGEESGVPERVAEIRARSREILAAQGLTVPACDGSHDALPADKATDAAFWNLAKTIGIEADR
jgi:hypothetical protein